jgi:hypothetical protein
VKSLRFTSRDGDVELDDINRSSRYEFRITESVADECDKKKEKLSKFLSQNLKNSKLDQSEPDLQSMSMRFESDN